MRTLIGVSLFVFVVLAVPEALKAPVTLLFLLLLAAAARRRISKAIVAVVIVLFCITWYATTHAPPTSPKAAINPRKEGCLIEPCYQPSQADQIELNKPTEGGSNGAKHEARAEATRPPTAADRKNFARRMQEGMWRQGVECTVAARGREARTLYVQWALAGNATAFQFHEKVMNSFGPQLKDLSFTTVHLDDGFGSSWTWKAGKNF